MTDKPVKRIPSSHFEEKAEKLPLTADEIEVHLAIADCMRPVNPPCVILRGLLAQTFAFISGCV